MKAAIIDLMVKIDKMKSTTEIKEALGKIVIEHDGIHDKDKDNDIKIDVTGKVCCMSSVCACNCKDCDVDVNTTLDLGEGSKSCIIM
jgi:hypothetical protein